MKKVIALLIVISVVGLAIPAMGAVDIDLSSLDDNELLELKKMLTDELNQRFELIDDEIATGTFVAGKDIRVGCFLLTQNVDEFSAVKLFKTEEDYESGKDCSWENLSLGETACVNLTDGMVMELVSFTGTIVETEPSWAP